MHNIRNNRILGITAMWLLFNLTTASGQAKFIGRDFIDYCNAVPWEDMFIHTDREWYVSGENMWFSIYAIDRKTMQPSKISKIAYVELLNYDSRPVIRERILLTDGSGPGHISLPDTLSSGIYTLRTYTSWMKNFLPDGCFIKEIGIYNALNNVPVIKKPVKRPSPVSPSDNMNVPGFLLIADNTQPDVLKLSFETDEAFRSSVSTVCNLFIHTRGNINHSESVPLAGNRTEKTINKNSLLPGINTISVFDAMGRLIAERFIYSPFPASGKIEFLVENSYEKREKISLNIASPAEVSFKSASISVAPVAINMTQGLDEFLIFGTEFGNEIQELARDWDLNTIPPDSVVKLLEGLKSNWINWDIIRGLDSLVIKHLPETNDHFVTGKLINGKDDDDYVIMSQPGKDAVFNYSSTDNEGNFIFSLPADEERKELIIQPDGMRGSINIGSSFSELYSVTGSASDTIPKFVKDISVNFQVQKIYGVNLSEKTDPQPGTDNSQRFYGKPDLELVLADYIKLPVMEEIFFELLPGTYMKKRKSQYEIYVTDPVTDMPYNYPTTLLVDGIRVDDANAIAAIDPELVEKIDVVRERYMVGDYLFHGIVNIITKAGDFTAVPIPENAVRTYYRVIDPPEKFVAPDYGNEAQKLNRIPDFRNTLWWEPSIINANPSIFWSSDVPGDYRIMLNGIGADGQPVSIEKIISVH